MKQILEKLWNGRIAPCETCGANDPEIMELVRLVARNRESLEKELGQGQKETLEKLIACWEEYSYLATVRAFSEGFTLGGRIFAEVLTENG